MHVLDRWKDHVGSSTAARLTTEMVQVVKEMRTKVEKRLDYSQKTFNSLENVHDKGVIESEDVSDADSEKWTGVTTIATSSSQSENKEEMNTTKQDKTNRDHRKGAIVSALFHAQERYIQGASIQLFIYSGSIPEPGGYEHRHGRIAPSTIVGL